MKDKSGASEKKQPTKAGKSSNRIQDTKKLNKDKLKKQLTGLIKDIDEDGIMFLIKQAQVLIYNKKVDEHNIEIKKGARITIEQPPFSDKLTMEIKEADDNSSFIFVINRTRKFFTLEEMKKIVKLCHLSTDENDASHRLFTWYKNNRGDVLIDIGIESSNDPALGTMYNNIIKKYKVKDNK